MNAISLVLGVRENGSLLLRWAKVEEVMQDSTQLGHTERMGWNHMGLQSFPVSVSPLASHGKRRSVSSDVFPLTDGVRRVWLEAGENHTKLVSNLNLLHKVFSSLTPFYPRLLSEPPDLSDHLLFFLTLTGVLFYTAESFSWLLPLSLYRYSFRLLVNQSLTFWQNPTDLKGIHLVNPEL